MPSLIEPVVAAGTLRRMGPQPTLHIDELTMRPWRHADADDVVAAYADPDIQRWHVRTVLPHEAIDWIDSNNQRWLDEVGVSWAITTGEDFLGRIALRTMVLAEGEAELAYWVAKPGRGRGVAALATAAVTDWSINAVGLHRLELRHSTQNPASCRVAAKAGYPLEATLRSATRHLDGWHDMHLHAKVGP